MDARSLGILDGFPALVDISGDRPGQTGDYWPGYFSGDPLHGGEVIWRGCRETRLDDVNAEARQLPRHFDLLRRSKGKARRLLAVAKCGVEDLYVFRHFWSPPVLSHSAVVGVAVNRRAAAPRVCRRWRGE